MSSEWDKAEETGEGSEGGKEVDSPSSYFLLETSSKPGGNDQKSTSERGNRNTMTVEVEVHCRRKRWARPPVVGGGTDSESEEPRVSPSSSVASLRPLEWDSGADVGYTCYPPGEGEEGVRREPEGRTRETESKSNTMGPPTSESTPKYSLFPEARVTTRTGNGSGSVSASEDVPITERRQPASSSLMKPSNSSSSVNTVVTNSEQTLSRHQDLGARSESVEWVSVEGEAERGAELLAKLVEGRDPSLAKAILGRVFTRLVESSPGLDKCISTGRSLLINNENSNKHGDSSISADNSKPSIEGESEAPITDTSTDKRPCSSSSISEKINNSIQNNRRWDRRIDWRKPATATEKLREQQDTSSESVDDKKLTEMINSERKTQLEWIKSEISHLSILQKLLEKHEELKKNVIKLKRQTSGRRVTPVTQSELSQEESGWSSHNYQNYDSEQKPSSRMRFGGGRARDGVEEMGRSTPCSILCSKSQRPAVGFKRKSNIGVNTGGSLITATRKSSRASQTSPRNIAYEITFKGGKENIGGEKLSKVSPSKKDLRMVSLEELHAALDMILNPPSLQDDLLDKRPDVVKRVEERRQIVKELVDMREKRAVLKREILASGGCQVSTSSLPPPPLAVKKVVSAAERRRRRHDKGRQKEEAKKKEEAYRTNRLMAQMFTRKLQARALKGQVDLSNSTSVISSI